MDILLIIVSLSVLILVHEIGHFASAKFFKVGVEEFGIGFPPRLFGKKYGETTYSVNALPFGGFVKIKGEDGKDENGNEVRDVSNFSSQSVWKRVIMLAAGVCMNMITGWIIFSVVFMAGIPTKLAILEVFPDSPAAKMDIKPNDFIVSATYGEKTLTNPIQTKDFIYLVKEAGENQITIEIERGGEKITKTIEGRANPPEGQGSLGIGLGESGIESKNFFVSIWEGLKYTSEVTQMIIVGFFDLIIKIFSTPDAVKNVAGPVGIVMIAKQATDIGFVYFFQLLGLISVNLAVLNLLPFPALDGGRILMLLIEKIKKNPVSERVQSYVNMVGFFFLIALMLFVTFQDITKLFK
jgi:regulator of sigma E protease